MTKRGRVTILRHGLLVPSMLGYKPLSFPTETQLKIQRSKDSVLRMLLIWICDPEKVRLPSWRLFR
jgi:hypothetical protein